MELGLKLIEEMTTKVKKIQERLKSANDKTTLFSNKPRQDLEFKIGDKVWLKEAPTKGTFRFSKREKLALRYVGLYGILERVGRMAYRRAWGACMMYFM